MTNEAEERGDEERGTIAGLDTSPRENEYCAESVWLWQRRRRYLQAGRWWRPPRVHSYSYGKTTTRRRRLGIPDNRTPADRCDCLGCLGLGAGCLVCTRLAAGQNQSINESTSWAAAPRHRGHHRHDRSQSSPSPFRLFSFSPRQLCNRGATAVLVVGH